MNPYEPPKSELEPPSGERPQPSGKRPQVRQSVLMLCFVLGWSPFLFELFTQRGHITFRGWIPGAAAVAAVVYVQVKRHAKP